MHLYNLASENQALATLSYLKYVLSRHFPKTCSHMECPIRSVATITNSTISSFLHELGHNRDFIFSSNPNVSALVISSSSSLYRPSFELLKTPKFSAQKRKHVVLIINLSSEVCSPSWTFPPFIERSEKECCHTVDASKRPCLMQQECRKDVSHDSTSARSSRFLTPCKNAAINQPHTLVSSALATSTQNIRCPLSLFFFEKNVIVGVRGFHARITKSSCACDSGGGDLFLSARSSFFISASFFFLLSSFFLLLSPKIVPYNWDFY